MGQVQQQITLTTTIKALNVSASGGTVTLERSATTQAGVAPYVEYLMIDPQALKYVWHGDQVWDVNPLVLTGPGANALVLVIADIDAATAAGVFNL